MNKKLRFKEEYRIEFEIKQEYIEDNNINDRYSENFPRLFVKKNRKRLTADVCMAIYGMPIASLALYINYIGKNESWRILPENCICSFMITRFFFVIFHISTNNHGGSFM